MMNSSQKSQRRFWSFVFASVLLHFVLFILFYKVIPERKKSKFGDQGPKPPVVFVRPQDILSASQPVPKRLELADLAKPKIKKKPKQARFASQYDSSVSQETVARRRAKNAKVNERVSRGVDQAGGTTTPGRAKKTKPRKKQAKTKTTRLEDLQLGAADLPHINPMVYSTHPGFGQKRKPGELLGQDRFVHDFLPGIKIGNKTYLNAFAMPHVQYFTRLKRTFRVRFNPSPPLRSHFRTRGRLSQGQVKVSMAMEVNAAGRLTKIFVIKSSGIPGYDHEALRTVKASAPFSSPPKDIKDKDGMLRMTWNFITYL